MHKNIHKTVMHFLDTLLLELNIQMQITKTLFEYISDSVIFWLWNLYLLYTEQ